jgi:hypothetical protein
MLSALYSLVSTGLALQLSAFVPHMEIINDPLISQVNLINDKEQ